MLTLLLIIFSMCISPNYIPNPNLGAKKVGFNLLKDCTSEYIPVPCHHCPQCVAVRQMELIERVHMEASICHLFFGTLTYNDEFLPTYNVNGYDIHYARMEDVSDMIKRVRRHADYPFRYIIVSEFGSKYGRPHVHLLLSVPKVADPSVIENHFYHLILKYWSRNYGSLRKPIYKPLCTFTRRFVAGRLSTNYDFHYVNPLYSDGSVADVGFYILKYMLKADQHEQRLQQALRLNLIPELYDIVYKKVKSKQLFSKGFGLLDFTDHKANHKFSTDIINDSIRQHIRKGIAYGVGKSPFPLFINPLDGKTFPLSEYYKHHFFTARDAYDYYFENVENSPYIDSIHDADIKSLNQTLSVIDKYKSRCDVVNSKTFL